MPDPTPPPDAPRPEIEHIRANTDNCGVPDLAACWSCRDMALVVAYALRLEREATEPAPYDAEYVREHLKQDDFSYNSDILTRYSDGSPYPINAKTLAQIEYHAEEQAKLQPSRADLEAVEIALPFNVVAVQAIRSLVAEVRRLWAGPACR